MYDPTTYDQPQGYQEHQPVTTEQNDADWDYYYHNKPKASSKQQPPPDQPQPSQPQVAQ